MIVLALMLAACSPDANAPHKTTAIRVPCARGGAPMTPRCTVERQGSARGTILTLRAADGGFRRLLVVGGGQGLAAADGAEPARIAVADAGAIDVRIGEDRYRLPATVGPGTAKR